MNLFIGAVLIIGDGFAHGHQMFLIAEKKSTKGLSAASVVMNFASSLLVTSNLIALKGDEFFAEAWADGFSMKALDATIALLQMLTFIVLTTYFSLFLIRNKVSLVS